MCRELVQVGAMALDNKNSYPQIMVYSIKIWEGVNWYEGEVPEPFVVVHTYNMLKYKRLSDLEDDMHISSHKNSMHTG